MSALLSNLALGALPKKKQPNQSNKFERKRKPLRIQVVHSRTLKVNPVLILGHTRARKINQPVLMI